MVSELIGLKLGDIHIDSRSTEAYIRINGKGRKERHVPLWKSTTKYLADYMRDQASNETGNLFMNCLDGNLTRSGVRYRLDCLKQRASEAIPSLAI
jgi:integrase/recombinase XerD